MIHKSTKSHQRRSDHVSIPLLHHHHLHRHSDEPPPPYEQEEEEEEEQQRQWSALFESEALAVQAATGISINVACFLAMVVATLSAASTKACTATHPVCLFAIFGAVSLISALPHLLLLLPAARWREGIERPGKHDRILVTLATNALSLSVAVVAVLGSGIANYAVFHDVYGVLKTDLTALPHHCLSWWGVMGAAGPVIALVAIFNVGVAWFAWVAGEVWSGEIYWHIISAQQQQQRH